MVQEIPNIVIGGQETWTGTFLTVTSAAHAFLPSIDVSVRRRGIDILIELIEVRRGGSDRPYRNYHQRRWSGKSLDVPD